MTPEQLLTRGLRWEPRNLPAASDLLWNACSHGGSGVFISDWFDDGGVVETMNLELFLGNDDGVKRVHGLLLLSKFKWHWASHPDLNDRKKTTIFQDTHGRFEPSLTWAWASSYGEKGLSRGIESNVILIRVPVYHCRICSPTLLYTRLPLLFKHVTSLLLLMLRL